MLTLKYITDTHFAWVERMGWHNKTPLEQVALIASEVGEVANECRGEKPTELLGEELADIILRTVDMAKVEGVDLEACILAKLEKNEKNGKKPGRIK